MDVMEIRRMLMGVCEGESYVYIPNYNFAYMTSYVDDNNRYVSVSSNNVRIGFFGTGSQAGIYKTAGSLNYPVIKIPNNTVSITISFISTSRLYNDNDVYVYWTKDEPCGPRYPNAAYYVTTSCYNARANQSALRINTLTVPEGADSFVGFFRVYPAPGSDETEESVASDIGFSIVFNKA